MAIHSYYRAAMQQETVEALHEMDYDQLETSVDDPAGEKFLVINRPDRLYWITDSTNLEHTTQLVEIRYREQIKPITLNEIQSWT